MSKKKHGENVLSPGEVQALRNQLQNATKNARLLNAKLMALEIARTDQVNELLETQNRLLSDIADLLTRCAEVEHDRSESG